MLNTCNVRIVSTPFGINGLECYDGNYSAANPHLLQNPHDEHVPATGAVVGGAGGVRALRKRENGSSPARPVIMASLHHKGKLVVWDVDTMDVVGCCDHSSSSVIECIITPTFIYVRVENEMGLEDKEASIFVWNTQTLKLYRRVIAHDGRVTSLAVSDQSDHRFATAGVDQMVHLWDLEKDHIGPVKKITLQSGGTVSLYHSGTVFVSCADHPIVVWNATTGAEIFRAKEGGGRITLLRWQHDPQRVRGHSDLPSDRSLIIAFSNGFIKEWKVHRSNSTDASLSLSLTWGHKVHRTSIDDICGDGEVVLSCSTVDGAFLLIPATGKMVMIYAQGTRAGLIDTSSKHAVVGGEDGSVNVFAYNNFCKEQGTPVAVSTFRPHIGSITGMFLQLQKNQRWDRLMCGSADGKLSFLDYSKSRSGSWIDKVRSQSVDYAPAVDGVIVPQRNGSIIIVDCKSLQPSAKQPPLKLSRPVIAVKWIEPHNRMLLALDSGELIAYECRVDEEKVVSFFELERRSLAPYIVPLIVVGELACRFAVACFRKEAVHEGGFLVIDVDRADLTFPLQKHERSYAVRCNIVQLKAVADYDYAIVLLLRDGTITHYVGNSVTKGDVVVMGVISGTQLPTVHSMELLGLSIFPSQFVLSIDEREGEPPYFTLIFAEGARLKKKTFKSVGESSSVVTDFATKIPPAALSSSDKALADVVCLTGIYQGDMGIAVIRDSPYVDILSPLGEYLYRVSYGGDVLSYHMVERHRRHVTFPFDVSIMNDNRSLAIDSSNRACCAVFCSERRYLAIGYRDGSVQLFDTTQHIVFCRCMSHVATVTSLWAFPTCTVSFSVDGGCYINNLCRRVMFG